MSYTHLKGENLWLLKPTGYNRGKGLLLFKNTEKIRKLLFKIK